MRGTRSSGYADSGPVFAVIFTIEPSTFHVPLPFMLAFECAGHRCLELRGHVAPKDDYESSRC